MFFLDKLDLIVNRALEGVLNNSVRHVNVRYYLGVQISFLQETLILVARVQDVDKLCFQTCQTVGHYNTHNPGMRRDYISIFPATRGKN